MRRRTSSPPVPKRARLSSLPGLSAAASSTPSYAGHVVDSESLLQRRADDDAAQRFDRTSAGDIGEDRVLNHFTSVSALTDALCDTMPDVLTSGVMDLLNRHVRGTIRAAAEVNKYTAAEQIVLAAAEPRRMDIRQKILEFVGSRPELHSCLSSPPELVQGNSSINRLYRHAKTDSPANLALRKILEDALQPVDDNLHSDILKGCLPNTRERVLDDLLVAVEDAISSGRQPLVWLKGLVGAGKTSVMSTLAARMTDRFRTAQFYCSRAEATRSDARRIIPTLTCSLGNAESALGRRLEKALQSHPNKVTAPSKQLDLFITRPLEGSIGPTVLFIDGLDECADVDALDQFLDAIVRGAQCHNSSTSQIVFIVSSRAIQRISANLSGRARVIDLDDLHYREQTQQDTSLYIRHRLSREGRLPRERKFCNILATLEPPPSEEEAIEKLVEVAGGHFVIASFTCSAILDPDGDSTFLSETLKLGGLKAETVTLYERFSTALKATFAQPRWRDGRAHQRVRRVLATVCWEQEPSTSAVIASLSKVDFLATEAILRALAPFLVHALDRHAFFHASVADFLESDGAGEYQINASEYHGELFSSCCDILRSQLDFNMFGITNSNVTLHRRHLRAISPELVYASTFWTHHLAASSLPRKGADSAVTPLLESKFLFWLEVLSGLQCVNSAGIGGLNRASTFLKAGVGDFVTDCLRCLDRWNSDISRHPCRIYLTVIPWVPQFFRKALCAYGSPILSAFPRVLLGSPSQWSNGISTWDLESWVYSVAWSPNGHLVAAGKGDGTVELRDPRTGERHGAILHGHTSSVSSVAFSPDGLMIASGSDDTTVRLWDTRSGAPCGAPLRGHTSSVSSVAFRSDGLMIVSGSDDTTVRLWDTRSGAPHGAPIQGHTSWVNSVAFSPDGLMVASGSNDKTVRLWDTRSAAPHGAPFQGHTSWVNSVVFSPDGLMVASGSFDKTVRLWDTESGAQGGEPLRGHTSPVWSVAFSLDGSMIASGSSVVRLWDTESRAQRGEPLRGHTSSVVSIAFSPDGSVIASGSYDDTVRLWDTRSGAPRGEPLQGHTSGVSSVAFSSDGSMIASGSIDGTVRLWDTRSGAPRGEPLQGHTSEVSSVAFSSDGSVIASGSSVVRLWDTESGAQCGEPLRKHTSSIVSIAFSLDGSMIASGSIDDTVRLWDVRSGAPRGEPLQGHTSGVNSVAFSSDGSMIASGSDDTTVRLWDTRSGAPCGAPLRGHTSSVSSVAIRCDGLMIASASHDKTVQLWDTRSGVPCGKPLRVYTSWIRSVAFSEDGTKLTSFGDKEILTWNLATRGRLFDCAEPSHAKLLSYRTPKPKFPLLPQGYEMIAYSPASRMLAGRFKLRENELFAMSLPSDDPWKTLCNARAQSQRAKAEQRRSTYIPS